MRLSTFYPVLLASAMVALGCGGGSDLPPTEPVRGVVTLDGQPLPRGMVQFVPDVQRGTKGPPATGEIASGGRYQLRTAGRAGAMIGHHRVRVEATERLLRDTDPPPESLIPARYNKLATSGLQFEVKPEIDNNIEIQLISDP